MVSVRLKFWVTIMARFRVRVGVSIRVRVRARIRVRIIVRVRVRIRARLRVRFRIKLIHDILKLKKKKIQNFKFQGCNSRVSDTTRMIVINTCSFSYRVEDLLRATMVSLFVAIR